VDHALAVDLARLGLRGLHQPQSALISHFAVNREALPAVGGQYGYSFH
jgi:hypothetical protein